MDVHLVLEGLLSNLINFEKYRHCLMLLGNTLNNLAEVSSKVHVSIGVTSLIALLNLRHRRDTLYSI